jgi:hypothetical protein
MIKMSTAGSTNTTSGKFSIMEDGRILGARGHMHGTVTIHLHGLMFQTNVETPDGGVGMHMFINDKFTCTSEAVYGYRSDDGMGAMGGHGHMKRNHAHRRRDEPNAAKDGAAPKGTGILTVASMSDCDGPYKVVKGDTIVLKAEYDLQKHPL